MEMCGEDVSTWSLQGFHRYSTDQHWHVPHFEKMLYDQGQLAATYSRAFQVWLWHPSGGGGSLGTLSASWGGLALFGEQLQSLFPKMLPIPWAWSSPMLPFIYCSSSGQERCTNP